MTQRQIALAFANTQLTLQMHAPKPPYTPFTVKIPLVSEVYPHCYPAPKSQVDFLNILRIITKCTIIVPQKAMTRAIGILKTSKKETR